MPIHYQIGDDDKNIAIAALNAAESAAEDVMNLLPAIGALFPVRAADPGNSVAALALPVGGAWNGAGKLTGSNSRVDALLTCEADAGAVFYVVHGPTVAAVDACDPAAPGGGCVVDGWSTAAAWAAHLAPVTLQDSAYALKWRGTAGKAITLAATLDPRPWGPRPFAPAVATVVPAGGAPAMLNLPPGAKALAVSSSRQNVTPTGNVMVSLLRMAPLLPGPAITPGGGDFSAPGVLEVPQVSPPFDLVLALNQDPATAETVFWAPLS